MIAINIIGVALIFGIAWWFWFAKPNVSQLADSGLINISVENGMYDPAYIEVPVNKATTLRFLRKDASPCAGTVIFNELNISEELPVNKTKDIIITPPKPGTYSFACQMKMYRGDLRAVESAQSKSGGEDHV